MCNVENNFVSSIELTVSCIDSFNVYLFTHVNYDNWFCRCVATLHVLIKEERIYISHRIISHNPSSYRDRNLVEHLLGKIEKEVEGEGE